MTGSAAYRNYTLLPSDSTGEASRDCLSINTGSNNMHKIDEFNCLDNIITKDGCSKNDIKRRLACLTSCLPEKFAFIKY